jgi:Asp/Glu/hydantoin racemase
VNLLDDSLSADLASAPNGLDDAMSARFVRLARYALSTGADGILFTCSAFGPCIDAVAREFPAVPVLKPNEAMITEATSSFRRIGLVATFPPTLASMPAEFPPGAGVRLALAEGAMDALSRGDGSRHDALVGDAAARLAAQGCDVIALAQFSMARAQPVAALRAGLPVLTTVASAARALRSRVERA